MPRCYSYIRFSSKKQEQGDSVRRQISLRDRWISAHKGCFLDETINLHDFGLSAYSGDNLDPSKGNLGKFMELCRQGKIERDSYLILERVDRFSRKAVFRITHLFQELVDYGLKIVVLEPSEQVIDESNISNIEIVIPVVLSMQIAFEQSREKSRRVGEAWKNKRDEARKNKIATAKCPAWLRLNREQQRFEIDPEAKKAIEFIFEQASKGVGQVTIVRELNRAFAPIVQPTEKNPNPLWNTSYVHKIIHDRSVLGMYQPMRFDESRVRVPDGEEIKNYYPRVISDELFVAARLGQSTNKKINSFSKTDFINIFRGLLFCSSDGHSMQINTSRATLQNGEFYTQRRLVSYGHKRRDTCCPLSIEYFSFEEFILSAIKELSINDLVDHSPSTSEIDQIEKQIRSLRQQSQALKDQIDNPRNISIIATLAGSLRRNQEQLELLTAKIANLTSVPARTRNEISSEIKLLTSSVPSSMVSRKEYRSKLCQLLPSIIERIDIRPCKFGNRTVGCDGIITLRTGGKRKFKFKKNINRRWYAICDSKNTVVSLTTFHGWVFYERGELASEAHLEQSSQSGRTKYQNGTAKPTNEEISADFHKMRNTFREELFWSDTTQGGR